MTKVLTLTKTFGIALFGTLFVLGSTAIWHFAQWRESPLPLSDATTYEIAKGSGAYQIIGELSERGIVTQALYFRVLIELTQTTNHLKAGEYKLLPGVSPAELLTKFARGDVIQHKVTIVDGITVSELLGQLNGDPRLERLPVAVNAANLAAYLNLSIPFVEGYFLPDTYQFERDASVATLLIRAHQAMTQTLADIWVQRDESQLSHLENREALLTLASIIEKETGRSEERGQISQVFHRRLDLNMRLQTDPTVIYALGANFDGNIRRRDLTVDSPFNTYKVKGLPPTPIALPSIASLLAAAKPAAGDYLYFVARGDGSSQFSRTLKDHNAAIRKYQLKAK